MAVGEGDTFVFWITTIFMTSSMDAGMRVLSGLELRAFADMLMKYLNLSPSNSAGTPVSQLHVKLSLALV